MRRDLIELPLRDLDVVAENAVVADLQRAYPGGGAFTLLDFGQDILAAAGYLAQAVYLLVEAVLDNAAVLEGQGRIVDYRVFYQRGNVVQLVYLAVELPEKRAVHPGNALLQSRKPRAGLTQRVDILRGRGFVHYAGHEPLKVVDAVQRVAYVVKQRGILRQGLHRVVALEYLCGIYQRLLQPCFKFAPAHGGHGLIQHPQQRTSLFLGAHGLGQLEVSAGREVQTHELAVGMNGQRYEALYGRLLGLAEVAEHRAQRLTYQRHFGYSKLRAVFELVGDDRHIRAVEAAFIEHFAQAALEPVAHESVNLFKVKERLVYKYLHRAES